MNTIRTGCPGGEVGLIDISPGGEIGRRGGLKSRCPSDAAGSTPALGTTNAGRCGIRLAASEDAAFMVKAESDAEYFLLHHDNGQKSNTQPLYRELELRHIRVGFITKRFPGRGVMRMLPQVVVCSPKEVTA